MIFLFIYIGFSLLTALVAEISAIVMAKEIKREHPLLTKEYNEKCKRSFTEKACNRLLNFIKCFIPLINIAALYACLFEKDKIKEKFLEKIEAELELFDE